MELRPDKGEVRDADNPRILGLLRRANYPGWFTLEYEFDADPFVEVPKVLDRRRPLLG